MQNYPLFLSLADRRVIVVGGGEAAARKARLVASAGARLTFFAEVFEPALRSEWSGRAEFSLRLPEIDDFAGASLAFVAVSDEQVAAVVASRSRAAGVLVNVVDAPALSDFITPSIVDRGSVVVAISTGGDAPVLARSIRKNIDALLSQRLDVLARFARSFRKSVAERIAPARRRQFWEAFFDGPIAARVLAGDETGAREAMSRSLDGSPSAKALGVVHIVGAGPGDPELLTLKAHRLLQSADVILYDRLVSAEILDLSRRDALRLYVGKAKAAHAVPQDEIEARLIGFARDGKIVVRLKGGDPFIFGRGGEELDALRAAGIPVFVTPGITAAIGCAAAATMPLTHRHVSQALTLVTGHAEGNGDPEVDWAALASLKHTLVVYMGVGRAGLIAERLIAAGRDAETPVAVIEKGTTPDQKVIKGALIDLDRIVTRGGVVGPALLVIGDVAAKASGEQIEALAIDLREAA